MWRRAVLAGLILLGASGCAGAQGVNALPAGTGLAYPTVSGDSGSQFQLFQGPAVAYGHQMALGADGNVWFRSIKNSSVGFITPTGSVTEYRLPAGHGLPHGIAAGPDGNIWYTDDAGNTIGRITLGGVVTNFPMPSNRMAYDITAGPDGKLWFTALEPHSGHYSGPWWVGRMTTEGAVKLYPITTANPNLGSIVAGADGNVWFTNPGFPGNSFIGKITQSGVITQYPTPSQISPGLLTLARDRDLYATATFQGTTLLKVTMTGAMTVITDPANPSIFQNTLATGPDGNVWGSRLCIDPTRECLDRYNVRTGGFVEHRFPTTVPNLAGLVAGSDGNLWFQQFSRRPMPDGLGVFRP